MSDALHQLEQLRAGARRRQELRKCQTDLWYLATTYLGYGWNPLVGGGRFPGKGLTVEFHEPVCRWIDRHRDESFLGMWFQRGQHKTTIVVAEIVQAILRDPWTYLLYFHAVDEEAENLVKEVGRHFLFNRKLRSLDPIAEVELDGNLVPYRVFPDSTAKRFLLSNSFDMRKPHKGSIPNGIPRPRWPTLTGRGIGSEVTGLHGKKAWADDIIGKNTIEDNQLPKVAEWFQNTLMPVVDETWVRVSGTPWSDWGLYTDFWKDRDWCSLVVPGSCSAAYVLDAEGRESLNLAAAVDWTQRKIHLAPDYTLSHPVYGTDATREQQSELLRLRQRQMKGNFPYQVMCDTDKTGDKLWEQSRCEHFCGLKGRDGLPGAEGPGVVFVLSDPAPKMIGSGDGQKAKLRGDSTKDYWAFAVVKVRMRGERREAILLDGTHSQEWATQEGMDEACRLMRKWRTTMCVHETYGGLNQNYDLEMQKAALRNGVRWTRYDRNGDPIRFRNHHEASAKNHRFADLASAAEQMEFLICETVPAEFLYGPEGSTHVGLLSQAREYRVLASGRNSLRYDDDVDATSRCMDPLLYEYVPLEGWEGNEDNEPLLEPVEQGRSRYCGV